MKYFLQLPTSLSAPLQLPPPLRKCHLIVRHVALSAAITDGTHRKTKKKYFFFFFVFPPPPPLRETGIPSRSAPGIDPVAESADTCCLIWRPQGRRDRRPAPACHSTARSRQEQTSWDCHDRMPGTLSHFACVSSPYACETPAAPVVSIRGCHWLRGPSRADPLKG